MILKQFAIFRSSFNFTCHTVVFFLSVLCLFFLNDVNLKRYTMLWSELLYSWIFCVRFLVFGLLSLLYFTLVNSDLRLAGTWLCEKKKNNAILLCHVHKEIFFLILVRSSWIRLYILFFDWFGIKQSFAWIQINRKMVNSNWFRFI